MSDKAFNVIVYESVAHDQQLHDVLSWVRVLDKQVEALTISGALDKARALVRKQHLTT